MNHPNLSNTPKLYSHSELSKPAPIIDQPSVEPKQENPYLSALYAVGEAWI